MATDSASSLTTPTTPAQSAVAESITKVSEGAFLVVNEDTRTWEVQEVVDKAYGPGDDRKRKRALRLVAGTDEAAAIVLEEYPDEAFEVDFHILTSEKQYEADATTSVDGVEVLDTQIPWPVVRRGSSSEVFHRPAPVAAAEGRAEPACEGPHVEDSEFRFVRLEAIYPAKRACKHCVRRRVPRPLGRLNCPECERFIGEGLVHGAGVDGVAGVYVECPDSSCAFEGVVSIDGRVSGGGGR